MTTFLKLAFIILLFFPTLCFSAQKFNPITGEIIDYTGSAGGSGTINSGTTNRAARYTASTTLDSSTLIFDDATNVGIGTITPRSKIEIGVQAMNINGSNVGIGTINPTFPLQVVGNVGIGTTTLASTPYAININNVATFNSEFNIATNVGVGTTTVNWNNGVYQNVGIGTNGTNSYIAFTHPTTGGIAKLQLRILQDATGTRDLPLPGAWPTTVKWSGGTQPTLTPTAAKSDIINCTWNGTTDYCGTMLNF